MKQEDLNEIRANRPSPELLAYAAQLKEDAFERGCACINSNGYWDSECAWDGHTRPAVAAITPPPQLGDRLQRAPIST